MQGSGTLRKWSDWKKKSGLRLCSRKRYVFSLFIWLTPFRSGPFLFYSLSMLYVFSEKNLKKTLQKLLTFRFNPLPLQHIIIKNKTFSTMQNLESLTVAELVELKSKIELLISEKSDKKFELWQLKYNKYKGSGKCWIANIDPQTKKIADFLECESVEKRDNYSGVKNFKVPLIEGRAYHFRESGSKTNDCNFYKIVKDGQLVDL